MLGVQGIDDLSSYFTESWIERSETQVALYALGVDTDHMITDAEPNARAE